MNKPFPPGDILAHSPFAAFLGVEIDESDGAHLYRLVERERLVGNVQLPALHGGAIAAFLELCCAAELARVAGLHTPPRPISINLQYIASAGPVPTFSKPQVRRIGRRVAVVHGEAWQLGPDKPICAAQCEFRI